MLHGEPQAVNGYATSVSDFKARLDRIVILRKDLSMGRIVWEEGSGLNRQPRIDPMGEWIAWSRRVGDAEQVAIKSLKASSSDPPTMLDLGFERATLCDFTPDGDLLVTGSVGQTSELVVVSKEGAIRRRIATEVQPWDGASWRKYRHR